MRHHHRIALGGIKVNRLHHPGIQLIARCRGDGRKLFLCEGILRQLVSQRRIVLQDAQLLLCFRLVDRDTRRGIGIGIGIHEIGEITAEIRMVRAYRGTQLSLHPLGINLIDRTTDRALLRRLIVASLRCLVIPQEGGHIPVTLRDLTLHHTRRRIEINVRVTILLTDVGKAIIHKMDRLQPI